MVAGLVKNRRSPLIIWTLVVTTFFLGFTPPPASSALLPTSALMDTPLAGPERAASLKKIQAQLESKLVYQRLSDFGLSQAEILERLNRLSDDQVHQFASQLDSLQPGGDALGAVVVLLVIAILVVVLIQLTGHKVIITK
ncbi:MAG TPA: PA2779 family protein [Nitrospiria bacterium]